MSVIRKDLGMVTAYAYAVSKGYTGTEEQFATLMASYADVGQTAVDAALAAKASEDAAKASETASAASQAAAATSAGTATTAAQNASQSATAASGSATSAAQSATQAAGSATTASTKATEAAQSATAAAESATTAGASATAAQSAQTAAETAQTAAETAQGAAEDAAESVSASVAQIDQNTEDISLVKSHLEVIEESKSFTKNVVGAAEIPFTIANGSLVRVTNKTNGNLNVRLRATSGGMNLQTFDVAANSVVVVTATTDASYVGYYFNASGTAIIETGRFVDVENQSKVTADTVAEIINHKMISRSAAGATEYAYTIHQGDVFRVTTTVAQGVRIRFRAESGGTNLQEFAVELGDIKYITATVNASYISVYFTGAGAVTVETGRFPATELHIDELLKTTNVFDILVLEQGGITINGEFTSSTNRLRTSNYLNGDFTVKCPDGFVVFRAFYFDAVGYLSSYSVTLNKQTVNISVPDGLRCRLTFARTDNSADLTVNDIKSSLVLEDFENRISTMETPPMVAFSFDHEIDTTVATIVAEKQYTKSSHGMDDIYSYFDSLVTSAPDYVSRVDVAEELEMTYPRYANGIASGDADYLETPAYKTYMYKFICSNSGVNTTRQKKKKVIILGGVHGDEQAAPFNLYLFAQKLVNDYLIDENFYKLRATMDFYIVPCVNGYGMIHEWRLNGNGVNINRNFPIVKWTKSGTKGQDNYTGETAGSEFETQLVMALINLVKPEMFIDHHNYTYNLNCQFYTDIFNGKQLNLLYQALADISYVLKKEYPNYFGTGFDFVKNNGGAPGSLGETYGGTSRWAYEAQIPFSVTIEIGDCITYLNGVHAGSIQNYYGVDTFTVAEYTLRNQMLHYGQWVLDNA